MNTPKQEKMIVTVSENTFHFELTNPSKKGMYVALAVIAAVALISCTWIILSNSQ